MSETNNGSVILSTSLAGVATISFYHPSQNSLPADLLNQLTDKITEAGNNPQTRVIVIKSAGERTFCAGASFDELLQLKDKEAGATFFSGFARDQCLPQVAKDHSRTYPGKSHRRWRWIGCGSRLLSGYRS